MSGARVEELPSYTQQRTLEGAILPMRAKLELRQCLGMRYTCNNLLLAQVAHMFEQLEMNKAYEEVLGRGDESELVRLMHFTGPCPEVYVHVCRLQSG
jgi:hypothetical protein